MIEELIPYVDFARIRASDFFPASVEVFKDDDIHCFLGRGDGECAGPCHFLWTNDHIGETSEIRIEAMQATDISDEVVEQILKRLKLTFHARSPKALVVECLESWKIGVRSLTPSVSIVNFIVGSRWPYWIQCLFDSSDMLAAIYVVRNDRLCL